MHTPRALLQRPNATAPCASTTEGGSPQQAAPNGQPDSILEYPVVVLAGFYIQELATVRELLDQIGGQDVRVVPSSPALLHQPVAVALSQPEPAWDEPVPPDWTQGGGWGQQRMILLSGIEEEGRRIILELLREVDLGGICPAVATPQNLGAPLGEVLAAALKQWRQASSDGGSGAAAMAAAVPAAAAAAGPAAEGAGIPVVDALPPLEAVVPEEVWQPASGGREQAGGAGVQPAGSAGRSAPEVLQAEFTERPPRPTAGQVPAAAEVPLDVIDVIATGGSSTSSTSRAAGSAAGRSGSAAAPPPAAVAAGDGASKLGAAADGDLDELESMDSEELLAAARAALGLDSASLQRLVDDAAAQAAASLNVPFVAEQGGADASSAAAGGLGGRASNVGAGRTASGSRKPWEAPAAAAQGASAAGTPAFKGFGSGTPVRRKQQRKGSSGAKKQADGSRQASADAPAAQQQAAGAAAAAMASGTGAGAASSSGGADSSEAAAEELRRQRQEQAAGEEGHILPPVDQFVLSREQLREVTERHGLDFEQLVAGLAERGIDLSE